MSAYLYQCSPNIVWVKDAGQTLLVDREGERSWLLHDAEGVMWDLLAVGHSYEKITQMISLILSLPEEQAERTLASVLGDWQEAGILELVG